MTQKFNETQIGLFKSLLEKINKNQINPHKIENLRKLSEFKICRNIMVQITRNRIQTAENKNNYRINELQLQEIIIAHMNKNKNKFNRQTFNEIVKSYFNYLESEQDIISYFSPIYNFRFDHDEIIIDESIKIRKIQDSEKEYLLKHYEKLAPILIGINKITHTFIIKVKNNVNSPKSVAIVKMVQTINKFRLIKHGDIYSGGVYSFKKSDIWNPQNKFDRIKFEPINTFSKQTYVLSKKDSKKFQTILEMINERYPILEKNSNYSVEKNKRAENYLKKYGDYFDRVVRRFNIAIENKDVSEKIVDLILTLEILLVSSSGENTLKLSQRTALFIGTDDQEKLKIWNHMKALYSFRSGQVHEFRDKKIKVKNSSEITKEEAVKRLEIWTRRAILQMISFSQEPDNIELSAKQLYEKIDESMFNKTLNMKCEKGSKTTLKLLEC